MNPQTGETGSQRQVPPPWHLPQGLLPRSGRSHTCLSSGSSSGGEVRRVARSPSCGCCCRHEPRTLSGTPPPAEEDTSVLEAVPLALNLDPHHPSDHTSSQGVHRSQISGQAPKAEMQIGTWN